MIHRCCWDDRDDMGMFFGDVANVPVVSPTSQSRLEKLNSVKLLITSPMRRRHVPVDAWMSRSLTTIWKPGFMKNDRNEAVKDMKEIIRLKICKIFA